MSLGTEPFAYDVQLAGAAGARHRQCTRASSCHALKVAHEGVADGRRPGRLPGRAVPLAVEDLHGERRIVQIVEPVGQHSRLECLEVEIQDMRSPIPVLGEQGVPQPCMHLDIEEGQPGDIGHHGVAVQDDDRALGAVPLVAAPERDLAPTDGGAQVVDDLPGSLAGHGQHHHLGGVRRCGQRQGADEPTGRGMTNPGAGAGELFQGRDAGDERRH